ncbi:MAG: hypothetical protein Q9160_004773 [Pyrenula sp. 1 TL-2023]
MGTATDDRMDGAQHARTIQISPEIANGVANNVEDFMTLVNEANEANERERHMKLRDAFRIYPKAIGYSVALSTALIMEGYDTAVVGSCNHTKKWG